MSSKNELLAAQIEWAQRAGKRPDSRGYLFSVEANLFQSLSTHARHAFSLGSGSELLDTSYRPAKMKALHSSAALAVNVFDYWTEREPAEVQAMLDLSAKPSSFEFESQFPTGLGGNPPNLDLALRFADGRVIGVESKFSEWLTSKPLEKDIFKAKYFPVGQRLWENCGLVAAQKFATALHLGEVQFRHLDVAQLLKHMLGLSTSHRSQSELFYIFYDWPGKESGIHRQEIQQFERLISSEMPFRWCTYQELFLRLSQSCGQAHQPYRQYLRQRYFANVV